MMRLHFAPMARCAPGSQASSAAIDGHRILDAAPARFRRQAVDLGGARTIVSAGCGGGLRRSSDTVMCGSALIEPAREVVLRALHQRGHHDREADTGRNAGNGKHRLPHAAAHMRPGDVEDKIHGGDAHAVAVLEFGRGRRGDPLALGETGERPQPSRVPRMPTVTSRLRTRVALDAQKPRCLAARPPESSSAFGFSRVTMLASTLMPGFSGVSSGSAILMRNVLAATSPIGVISFTLPSSRRSGKASVRNSTTCPDRDARDVLFVDLGYHLQWLWHADAEQNLPGFGDLADLAVAAQHDAVHRRHDGVVGDLFGLHRNQPLDGLQIHRGTLVRLRRRRRRARSDSLTRDISRLRNSSRALSSFNPRLALRRLSSRTSTSPLATALPSQSQISTMRSRMTLATFAQRTGSTAPVA